MIQRIHGKVTFECDRCGEIHDTDEREFKDALRSIREAGWTARKMGDDWLHYCEACEHENS
jgi:hypothetical protein